MFTFADVFWLGLQRRVDHRLTGSWGGCKEDCIWNNDGILMSLSKQLPFFCGSSTSSSEEVLRRRVSNDLSL